ncbi:MAG: hypothetical protein WBB39_01625 [Candidatus Saccharimonadales bacterium]
MKDESITRSDVDNIVRRSTDEILGVIQGFMEGVDKQFKSVDKRFDTVEKRLGNLEVGQVKILARLDTLEERVERLEHSVESLLRTAEAIFKRYDDMDIENAARDSQFEKLLAWARKVSEKTGIPLENL